MHFFKQWLRSTTQSSCPGRNMTSRVGMHFVSNCGISKGIGQGKIRPISSMASCRFGDSCTQTTLLYCDWHVQKLNAAKSRGPAHRAETVLGIGSTPNSWESGLVWIDFPLFTRIIVLYCFPAHKKTWSIAVCLCIILKLPIRFAARKARVSRSGIQPLASARRFELARAGASFHGITGQWWI